MMIGVLALQGGYAEHQAMLVNLGVEARQVRVPSELAGLDGLIIPGGESTTMRHLMQRTGLDNAIIDFVHDGHAVWGSCAGAILLAKQAKHLPLPPLGLIDVIAERNAFGRQVDSFIAPLAITDLDQPFDAIFIRAPVFSQLGSNVTPVASLPDGQIVAASCAQVLITAFHPELGQDTRLHEWFIKKVRVGCA